MAKKTKREICGMDTYASSERKHVEGYNSEYVYYLFFGGEQSLCELNTDEVKEVISCLQQALESNKEGGES